MTATIKPDWKLPEPPLCEECKEPMTPCAYITDDGWAWGWDTYECAHGSHEWENDSWDWPFNEDYADGKDWQAAGVEVV